MNYVTIYSRLLDPHRQAGWSGRTAAPDFQNRGNVAAGCDVQL